MGGMMMPEMLDWGSIWSQFKRRNPRPPHVKRRWYLWPWQELEIERIVEQQVARLVSDKEPKPPDSSTGGFANELELAAWEVASDEALEETEADG
jgi:hypothetical protein